MTASSEVVINTNFSMDI